MLGHLLRLGFAADLTNRVYRDDIPTILTVAFANLAEPAVVLRDRAGLARRSSLGDAVAVGIASAGLPRRSSLRVATAVRIASVGSRDDRDVHAAARRDLGSWRQRRRHDT